MRVAADASTLRGGMGNLADRVVQTLAPYLGQTAARASLRMFLEKSGVQSESFAPEHLPRLAETLKPGLKVFVGAAKADVVTAELIDLGKET